ncbi:S-layer homology domain-containing protein [Parageobacillus sp. KH3-4]|uniref:S-layer homology domain-containing protein n=1 Tax=Parageobacillus sp. KH3-4 TaxID=2916802 RepID=UPI001FCB2826|nr:S-layer homology domain-containing protein [Parageobacillus sp. KH3-4]BDG45717.1 S-layer protein [Parageobacillus sp. KH3-4]
MAYQPKSYRKFLAGSVSAALVATAVGPVVASAASFSDVNPSDPHAENISALVELGYIKGFTDGTFKPYESITRGQVAKIFARILKDQGFQVPEDKKAFDDVPVDAKDQELVEAAAIVKAAGVMTGTDGKLNPGQPITRQQMAKVLVEAFDLTRPADFKSQLGDLDKADPSFRDYIQTLEANGITKTADNNYRPTDTVTRAAFSSFVKRALDAQEAAKAPKVESVSAINGTTLQIKFNKAVNASSLYDASTNVIDSNALKITPTSSAANVSANNLLGSLSADGKVLTVTVKGGSEYFDGTYAVELMKDKVALKDNASVYVNEYKGLVTVSDKEGPTITGVSYDASDAIVTFSEALKSEGTVSLNGVQLTPGTDYDFTVGEKELRIKNLEAGKSYTLAVVGAKDVAGNFSTPNTLTYTLNVPTDNVKPTVAVSVNGTKATFKFSENLKLVDADGDSTAAEYAKITLGNGSVKYLTATEQDSTDKTKFVLDLDGELTGDFLNTTIKVEGFQDKAGNTGDAYTTSVTLQKDKTAPKFVSAMTKDDKLIVKYDEDVANVSLTATDLSIKFVDTEGVLTPAASPTTIGTVADNYDANGNGVIDGDEENYIVIPLTGSQFVSGGKLKAGTYTVTIAPGKVADTAANATTTATTFTVSVAPDTSTSAIVELLSATQQATPGQILVTFNNNMGPSALVAANYKLGGVTLPNNATLTFLNDKKNVLITLPEGYITANGDRVLEVANLKDVDGNTLKEGKTSVVVSGVKENVAPTATKVTLVDGQNLTVDFSEAIQLPAGTVNGVKVKVNGTEIQLDGTTPFALDATKKVLTIKAASTSAFKLTDTITVEFNDTNITDLAGNAVKNAVLSK